MTDNTTTADTTTLQPAAPRPAYRLPQPTSVDPRFTDGLFFDIAHALARNGFPRPAAPTGPTSRTPCTASSTRRTRDHRRHRPARQPARPEAVRHCGLAQTAWRWAVTRARVWLCPPRRIGQPHRWRFGLRRVEDRPESGRSEEHTSELQSRPHLVCRLLLEKKKHH